MISETLTALVSWSVAFIHAYGAYSVFLIVLLEEMLVPIPSPIVLMGSGFILVPAGLPLMDAAIRIFFVVALPAAIASTVGSFVLYTIGYFGGKPLIEKLKKIIRFSWKDVKNQEKKLTKGRSVWASIALLRAIPLFPAALISLTSGLLRLSWKKYAAATFIGSLPRAFILGFIGWEIGSSYDVVASKLNSVENLIALTIIIAAVYMLYVHRKKYIHHYNRIRSRVLRN